MPLFSTYALGPFELANRVVMAPMTRSRATQDHVPTDIMAEYYGQRAAGNLLITEGTAPDPNGCGYARIPGIWNDAQIEAWKAVTDAVHANRGFIALQLMHTGRVGHPLNLPAGGEILAPSAVRLDGEMYTDQEGPQPHPEPRAMTDDDVEATIEGFVTAARNARTAGFDAIELHGANGYLIEQFFSPDTNQRDDAWGGSREARGRFALEVARRCAEAIGAERVGIRLSPHGAFNGVTGWETATEDFVWLAGELDKLGLAWIHIVDHSAMGAPPVPDAVKAGIRQAFSNTVILCGGYDRDRAEADLDAGRGDVIAFGRPYLANPDLPRRLAEHAALNAPDMSTFYTPGPAGYTDYPALDQAG